MVRTDVENRKLSNLKPFPKGVSGNLDGRPKGSKNKSTKLKKLILHLSKIKDSIDNDSVSLVHDLYNISISVNIDNIPLIYFIRSDFGIKVGQSSDIDNRFISLRKTYGKIELIKTIRYAGRLEYDVHGYLKDYLLDEDKYGSEWFVDCDYVVDFIDSVSNVSDVLKKVSCIDDIDKLFRINI